MLEFEYLNAMHRKYHTAYEQGKITKEKYDEFVKFYEWVCNLYTYKIKSLG